MEILFFILGIIGTILKFIFLAFFYILIFLLIVLIIILITPIKVKLNATVKSDNLEIDVNNITANVFITYLFRILKVSLIFFEGKLTPKVKIFWFNLNLNKVESEEKNKENSDENKIVEIPEVETKEVVFDKVIDIEELETKEKVKEEVKEETKEEKQSIKEKLNVIFEKINFIKEYPNKKIILNLIKKHLLKIVKTFKPVYINIIGKFGLENPADTGQILGGLSILNSFSYLNIDLEPDFENPNLDLTVDFLVSFKLWTIIFNLIVLVVKVLRLHLKSQGLTFVRFIKSIMKKGEKNGR